MARTNDELVAELEELRAKYAEAEELIHAIRTGSVDGLLIEGSNGPQVYTLKSAEHPYRVMVEQMNEGAATLDREGIVLYTNRRLSTLLGVPLERLVGQSFRTFVEPSCLTQLDALLRSGNGQGEVQLSQTNGGSLPATLSLSELAVEGAPYRCVVVTDLSAVKQNEQLRLEHAEAQRMSRAKDEFMAMVSHELRTPMTSILGWASLIKMSTDDPRLRESGLDAIFHSAKVQARLIDDLLDMSRLESGKLSMSMTTLELAPLVRQAIDNLHVAASGKALRIEERLSETKMVVRADSSRLYQIVWNLLSNAFKFSPRGGRIEVGLEPVDDQAVLRIADEGIGISPDYLPKIFDRFSQADGATTRRFGGLGLGLAIVRQLVAVHGGTVHAESEGENRGAVFTVRLPLVTAESEPIPRRDENLTRLDGLTVLIVEDDRESLEFIAALVKRAGGTPLSASSVDTAVDLLSDHRPHVVVSDIAMPGEDGLSFIRKLRVHDGGAGRHTPAIAVSAIGGPEGRDRAIFAGFDLFLEKPLDVVSFAKAISEIAALRAMG